MNQHDKATGSVSAGRAAQPPCTRLPTVLHIDDDPNDAELLRAATRRVETSFQLQSLEDGDQAMAYLTGHAPYTDRETYPQPALILLDLKMPRMGGFEVLRWIRGQPQLKEIPVIMLSGSELKEDVQQAYQAGAHFYMVKPLGFDALVAFIQKLQTTWLTGGFALPPA
jgi:CheY-like chemotaxis protein